jgi:hypothetical protein
MPKYLRHIMIVSPALAVYAFLAHRLNFVQDDAYITYRYVANFLNGDGLVYNIGERIEGFTNFGWTIFLIFGEVLGISQIGLSQVAGFVLGAGVIVLTYLIARIVLDNFPDWLAGFAAFLVGCNQSLAYWSPAGLETAAFAFVTLLSVYLFLRRSRWLTYSILLAVWIRPEGALVAGILILIEAVLERRLPMFTLRAVGLAFVLSLPYVAFKLFYYGSILPNPFYAKTGFNAEHLSSGLEYAGRYFSHYGFWGFSFIVPLMFFKRLSREARTVLLFAIIWIIYVILVGGDVLKVHRFFIPIFGPAAVLAVLSVVLLLPKLKPLLRWSSAAAIVLVLSVITFWLPHDFVSRYNRSEREFTSRMQLMARNIKTSDGRNFSIAASTIGIFGYELIGHQVIDMLGLTDSVIARHPEPPIEGMKTTWKERHHNSKYILSRAPEYIMFSTGVKPSAPAERALLLYSQFLDNYRTVGWFRPTNSTGTTGIIESVFKKIGQPSGTFKPTYPVSYVQQYKAGLDCLALGDHESAIHYYDRAIAASPKPYNPYLLNHKAFSLIALNRHQEAAILLDKVLASDSLIYEAHQSAYIYAVLTGNRALESVHERWLKRLVPWYWPKIRQDAQNLATQMRSGRR